MTNFNASQKDSNIPSAQKERMRMEREVAVLFTKLTAIKEKLTDLYDVVESWSSCDEVYSAIAKHQHDYLVLLRRQTDIYHKFIRVRSLQEWNEARMKHLKNEGFSLEELLSDNPE